MDRAPEKLSAPDRAIVTGVPTTRGRGASASPADSAACRGWHTDCILPQCAVSLRSFRKGDFRS